MDIGTGTSNIAIKLANYCKHVYAIDVSETMLNFARKRVKENNVKNITFSKNGFLDYNHKGGSLDAIISKMALHHLPDFWKTIAVKKVYDLLKPNGIFLLDDAIFSFEINEYENKLDNWIIKTGEKVDKAMADDVRRHIKDENSTFDWIMELIIKKTGFEYTKFKLNSYYCTYCCVKK